MMMMINNEEDCVRSQICIKSKIVAELNCIINLILINNSLTNFILIILFDDGHTVHKRTGK